jgi:hypothetical protein
MLSRFGADHRIERERRETMVATKLVHLLMHTIDEIRILPGWINCRCGESKRRLIGNLYDNFAASVRRAFEHLMSLTSLIEPQHFADFGL